MTAEPTTAHSKGKQPLDVVLAYALDTPHLGQQAKEKVVRYVQDQASLSNNVDEIDRVLEVCFRFILYEAQVFIRNLAKEVYESWARAHQERVVEYVFLNGRLKELLSVTGESAQHSGSDSMSDVAMPSEHGDTDFNDKASVADAPAGRNEPQSNGHVMEGQTFVLITASFTALSGFTRETLMRLIADVYHMLPEYITHHRGNIFELASVGVFLTSTGTLAWQNPGAHIWPVLRSVVCSLAAAKQSSLITCKNQPAILVVLKTLFRLCWEGEAQADKRGKDVVGNRLCDKVINLILKLAAAKEFMEMPSVLLVPVIDTIPVSTRLSLAISQALCGLSDAEVTKLLLCLDFWCDNWKIPSRVVVWLLEVLELLIESGRAILISRPPIIAMLAKYVKNPSTNVRAVSICDTLIRLEANKLFRRAFSEAEVCHNDDSMSPTMIGSGTSDSQYTARFGLRSNGELLQLNRSGQRLGLKNPGFYCYMNSVLQMLFAATRFRYDVLRASNSVAGGAGHASAGQPVLRQLQQVFAFMEYSVRSFYDPSDFRQAALPVQFNAMQQHDCSEFLGHLLDELHEQERAYRHLLPPQRPTASSSPNCTTPPHAVLHPSGDAHDECNNGLNCCHAQPGSTHGSSRHSGDGEIITEAVALFADMETGPPLDLSADVALSHDSPMKGPITSPAGLPAGVTGKGSTTIEAAEVDREDPTISWRHFGGCQLVTTRCLSCGTVSRKREPFLHIPVHVPREDHITAEGATVDLDLFDGSTPPPPTVAELIQRAVGDERLEQDNQLLCDRCGCSRDAVRSAPVCAAPQYLIVTLCRFGFDRSTGARTKTSTPVRCDEHLALPVMLLTAEESPAHGHSVEAGNTADDVGKGVAGLSCGLSAAAAEYRLLAAVSHLGANLSGGHYVCHARHTVSPRGESVNEAGQQQQQVGQQQWFLFDDNRVSQSSFDSIPGNALLTTSRTSDAATAYVLLYERIFAETVSPVIDADGLAVPAVLASTVNLSSAAAGVTASGLQPLSAGHVPSSLATLIWHDNNTYAQAVAKLLPPKMTNASGNSGCRPFTEWPMGDNEDDDDDSFLRQAGGRLDDSTLTGSRFIH